MVQKDHFSGEANQENGPFLSVFYWMDTKFRRFWMKINKTHFRIAKNPPAALSLQIIHQIVLYRTCKNRAEGAETNME
jgi:hypothetical protein